VAESHERNAKPPDNHNSREEDAGLETFETDVGERLKAGIRDEEYAQRSIVLAIGHVKTFLEAIDFGVGVAWSVDIEERRRIGAYNVGPVKEGHEVEETELWSS
jgi:hypothetical protein